MKYLYNTYLSVRLKYDLYLDKIIDPLQCVWYSGTYHILLCLMIFETAVPNTYCLLMDKTVNDHLCESGSKFHGIFYKNQNDPFA